MEPKGAGPVGSAVRSAMIWNFASMAFSQIALAGVFLLLARLLNPHVFGLFGLAAVLVDFAYQQGSSAVIDAVVRGQDFSRRMLSTVFWAIGFIAVGLVTALVLGAGLYGRIVGDPASAPVLAALAGSLLLVPFVIGPGALMRQQLDFKGIAIRGIVAAFLGGLAALAVAWSPWPEWSLVAQRWVSLGAAAILMTMRTRLIPAAVFDMPSARHLMGAAGRIFAGQGFAGAAPRISDLLIGIFCGAAVLGCVRVATKLCEVILAALVNPIGQLWLVMIAKAGAAVEQRRSVFLQLTKLTALIAVPGYLGVALVAHDFVALALAPEYASVADLLVVICAFSATVPFTNSRNGILTALNKLNVLIWLSALDLALMAAGMLLLHQFGIVAMLIGAGLSGLISLCISLPYVMRQMNVPADALTRAVLPPYVAAAVMCAGILLIEKMLPSMTSLEALLIRAAIGATLYVATLLIWFRKWMLDTVGNFFAKSQTGSVTTPA
jgi:O-antigen/teichoic acid export membrane protein